MKRLRIALVGIAAGALILLALDRRYPLPLQDARDGLVVLAADGTPLRAYPTGDGMWRYRVQPEDVSPLYLQALLGYEDRYFYRHPGINPVAMLRALKQWVSTGRIVSGGSTISMQVARILDGPADRTLGAKTRQIARALQLEAHLSKQEILALYLNRAPMGGIIEGVEMASRAYFGKSAASLSHAEAALLAVLPQSPSRNRPDLHPLAAQAARDKVLHRMADLDIWPAEVVADAKIEKVVAQRVRGEWLAPLAAERLKGEAPARQNTVRTTLDVNMQAQLESMLADRVRALPPKVSIAVLIMENDSLAVRAYAGSADFNDNERAAHVDMTRGVRSPGSTLKPFLYGLALDEGLIHSESLLVDAPQSFGGYAPGNFQANFSGPVSVSEALQRSLNVPAVDVLDHLGPDRFANSLRASGLKLRMDNGATPNLSLILGGAGTTLEELVGSYRALANGGIAGKPRLTLEAPKVETRLMSEGAAWIVREILESGGRPGRPFDEGGSRSGFAWKTGTSFGFRDAWALGVTDRYTVGVWIGRPDGTPNPGFFGANSAAPLAQDIAAILPPAQTLRPARPASVKAVEICWPLGLARSVTPADLCHVVRSAWALNDAVPPTMNDRARSGSLRLQLLVDAKSGERVNSACASTYTETEIARWPQYLEPWLSKEQLAQSHIPAWRKDCAVATPRAATLTIAGVENGSIVRAPANGKNTAINLNATGTQGQIYWLLNGSVIASQDAHRTLSLKVQHDGLQSLTALDEQGRYARIEFETRGFDVPLLAARP